LPSLELFKLCLETVPPAEKEHFSAIWIAHVRSLNIYCYKGLLIDMYLHIDNPDGAWSIFQEQDYTPHWNSDSTDRLFETMKKHDPQRLVPIFCQYVEKNVAEKHRKSYQRAAEWLVKLKSLYALLDQDETWNTYLYDIRENHRRLPALKDEIAKAGL
jgi:hypothetical protein